VSDSGTRSADFDLRGASLTFDALEKVVVQSVAEEEFEVAAEYLDQLFLLADQLDDYHEKYRAESERLAERDAQIDREEEAIQDAMWLVVEWAEENDHPVVGWFDWDEGGASA